MKTEELRYLQRLAELYPTIGKASTEIINLQSILNLPKGTEHFLSDIHGEYEAFSHVLRNGSGAVRKKIDDVFGHTLSNSDKRSLATLVYYPKEKIAYVKKKETDMENWYKITLYRLIEVCKTTASIYKESFSTTLLTRKLSISSQYSHFLLISSSALLYFAFPINLFNFSIYSSLSTRVIPHLKVLGFPFLFASARFSSIVIPGALPFIGS